VPKAPSPAVKVQGHEADHSPPYNAEAKNGGAIPPLPILLNGVVFNVLSTGTTIFLPYIYIYIYIYGEALQLGKQEGNIRTYILFVDNNVSNRVF
jgi:hypothetical protein